VFEVVTYKIKDGICQGDIMFGEKNSRPSSDLERKKNNLNKISHMK